MKQFIPKVGDRYYIPSLVDKSKVYNNDDSEFDNKMIERGIVFESEKLANKYHDIAMSAIRYELAKHQVAAILNKVEVYGVGTHEIDIDFADECEAITSLTLVIQGVLRRKISDFDSIPNTNEFIGKWWLEDCNLDVVVCVYDYIDYELIN